MKTKMLVQGFGELIKETHRLGVTKEPKEISCTTCTELSLASFSFPRKIW